MRLGFFDALIAATIIAIVIVLIVYARAIAKEKAEFMAECERDHKHYECLAMWGQAHPEPQQVWIHRW